MAKVKYGPGWRGFKAHLEDMPEAMQKRAAEIVEETVTEGADLMRGYSLERLDTGHMYRSIDHTVPRSGYFYGKFGWGLNGEAYEDYFRYQEQGFQHTSGQKIPPMHAMYKAFIKVREDFYRKVKEMGR